MSGEVPLYTDNTTGVLGQFRRFFRRPQERKVVPVRDWVNPWDKIYQNVGIPEDLTRPYFNFDFIIGEIERLDQPEGRSGRKRVLDVAMGPGRHTIALAEKGFEVYGFDISANALELARIEMETRNLRCDIRVGDMFGRYDYPDNYFDAVVAIQAIYHGYPPHMEAALEEINRVVRVGGLFVFTVSMDCERPMMDTGGRKFSGRALQERDFRKVEGYENTYIFFHGREAGLPHFYPGEEYLEGVLWDKGFNNLQFYKDSERLYRLVWCYKKE